MDSKERLKANAMSLCSSLEKHKDHLQSVSLGKDLYEYVFGNFYLTELVSMYNKNKVPLVEDYLVSGDYYRMQFKLDLKSEKTANYETPKVGVLVGEAVKVVSPNSRKLKKELSKHEGKTGVCLLALENQNQYVVEFPNGEVLAFHAYNIEKVENLVIVEDRAVIERYNGKSYPSLVLGDNANKKEIEKYLKNQIGKVDCVVVEKRYFLAEL
jgi:hypothetical protein